MFVSTVILNPIKLARLTIIINTITTVRYSFNLVKVSVNISKSIKNYARLLQHNLLGMFSE